MRPHLRCVWPRIRAIGLHREALPVNAGPVLNAKCWGTGGWRVRRALDFSADPEAYRHYIADPRGSLFGGGFRHDPDLLREGDEARVVLVGAQEGIVQQLGHTCVVRGPGVLQPLEHFVRFLAQGIHLSDLAGAAVGVFVDQFFQGRVGLRPVAIGKVGQRQCVGAPERIGFLFREFHRRSGFAAQNLNNRKLLIVRGGLRLQFDGLAHRRLGLVVAAERGEIGREVLVEFGA